MAQRNQRGMTTVRAPVFRLERLNLTVPSGVFPGLNSPARHDETGRHAAGFGEERLGHGETAFGDPAGAARRKAAAPRQAPHIGWAAGDCVDVAPPRLAVHGGSEETRCVGMHRRVQHLCDRPAFDDPAGIHHRHRIGDLGGDAEIMRHKDHAHAKFALQPAEQDQHLHCTVASSAVVGSSASSKRGSHDNAIAIIARWRRPPDNSCG